MSIQGPIKIYTGACESSKRADQDRERWAGASVRGSVSFLFCFLLCFLLLLIALMSNWHANLSALSGDGNIEPKFSLWMSHDTFPELIVCMIRVRVGVQMAVEHN